MGWVKGRFVMRPLLFITLMIFIFQPIAYAEIVNVGLAPLAEVRIRVGAQTGVTTVIHSVPATNIGDGTPIEGAPASVLIEASARRAIPRNANQTYFIISVDSSTPLSNGTNTISFTNISWTAQDGDIPSGNFNGSPAQVLLEPTRARRLVRDWHTFYYNNTQIVPYGTYTGSVTYTVSVP